MPAFTEGEWQHGEYDGRSIIHCDDQILALSDRDNLNAISDMHLMSLAPQLLEALRGLLDCDPLLHLQKTEAARRLVQHIDMSGVFPR